MTQSSSQTHGIYTTGVMHWALCLLGLVLAQTSLGQDLVADFDPDTGAITVSLGKSAQAVPLLRGEQTSLRLPDGMWHHVGKSDLICVDKSQSTGTDSIGTYNLQTWRFAASSSDSSASMAPLWELGLREYKTQSAVVLTQEFLATLHNVSTGSWDEPLSIFPQLGNATSDLQFLTFTGQGDPVVGPFPAGYRASFHEGVPLVLFSDKLKYTVVASPLTSFLETTFRQADNFASVNVGVQGGTSSVPQGFKTETLLMALEGGPTATMLAWGQLLQRYHNDGKLCSKMDSPVLHKVGYSTVGHYFYGIQKGGTYEDTVLGVNEYAQLNSLPYQWILIDSWWYGENSECSYPLPDKGCLPGYGGTWRWDDTVARNKHMFPNGLKSLTTKLNKTLVMHMGEWVGRSQASGPPPYASNASFDWVTEDKASLSVSPVFWDWLMAQAHDWGLGVFKIDHTQQQIPDMAFTQEIGKAAEWLTNQAKAASNHDIAKQYGGCVPSMILHSVTLENAIYSRVGPDYIPDLKRPANACNVPSSQEKVTNAGNPSISRNSLLHWAVGLRPYKDAFFTGPQEWRNTTCSLAHGSYTSPEWWGLQEPHSQLHAIVSTLTAGPVASCDGIGSTDRDLLMSTCNIDGTLLHPDLPALPLEASWYNLSVGEELSSTHVALGPYRWDYILGFALHSDVHVYPNMLPGTEQLSTRMAWRSASEPCTPFNNSHPLLFTAKEDDWGTFTYWRVAPQLESGWVLLGERDKIVSVSGNRFKYKAGSWSLVGAPQETVNIDLLDPKGNSVQIKCDIPASGTIELKIPGGC